MLSRLKKFQAILNEADLASFLITDNTNIRYLTGYKASDSYLLAIGSKFIFITDGRYTQEAKASLNSYIKVVETKKGLLTAVSDLILSHKVKTVGVDGRHVSVETFNALKTRLRKEIKLKCANNLVESMRVCKDESEIKLIKKALQIHHLAYRYLKRTVKPGVSEYDIFLRLERFVKKRQVGFSFDPIIASGANSSFPHAHVTQRLTRREEPLLIDMGIDLDGYKSDLTRMFFFDKIPDIVLDKCQKVAEAQHAALQQIAPGVKVSDLDRQARKILRKHKLEKYFSHSLGHGVGLDIHEAPRLSIKSNEILKPGMVITLEPAVYFPNEYGIRIEDMVLVTPSGYEVLSDHIY